MELFASERYEKILDLIQKQGSVTVAELMEMFDISIETVRRDLLQLEKARLLDRVYGGAVAVNQLCAFSTLPERLTNHKENKSLLCSAAVDLIRERDIIAMDSGSTALELADVIRTHFQELTIITNSPGVFQKLNKEGFQLIMVGGQYLRSEDACYGTFALAVLKSLRVAKSFVFPSSVSLKHGVGSNIPELLDVQQALMQIADHVYIMADSSKFETTALIKLCDISAGCTFVTDAGLDEKITHLYEANNIKLIRKG